MVENNVTKFVGHFGMWYGYWSLVRGAVGVGLVGTLFRLRTHYLSPHKYVYSPVVFLIFLIYVFIYVRTYSPSENRGSLVLAFWVTNTPCLESAYPIRNTLRWVGGGFHELGNTGRKCTQISVLHYTHFQFFIFFMKLWR